MKKMNVSRGFPALWAGIASVALLFAGCASGSEPDPDPAPGLMSGSYTVTFDKNYGDTEADPQTKTVTAPATTVGTLPEEPTREGYAFTGWNTDASGNGSYFTASTPVTKSLTVYAQWQQTAAGSFTVTFDSNYENPEAVPQTVVVTGPSTTVGTLPAAPTREGYAFNGWNTDSKGGGSDFTASTTVNDDFTVYAQWQEITPDSFTVTFDKNGGITEASPPTKIVNPPLDTVDALPTTQPTRAGYAFSGWNTGSEGEGSEFTASTTVSGSLTVYAQWLYVYTVTFDSNGGTIEANPQTKTVTEPATTVDALPAQPTRAGYAFTRWNTDRDGNGTAFTADTPVTASLTVYAQWLPVYTVTFNKNGGQTEAYPWTKTVTEPVTTVGTLPAPPTRAGFTFSGWYTAATGGTVFTASTTVTVSLTVYAQWAVIMPITSADALSAYLKAQSGGANASSPVTVEVDMELSSENWFAIMHTLKTAGKYVALNLAACTRSTRSSGSGLYANGTFVTDDGNGYFWSGRNWIVSLVLPNAATGIAGDNTNGAFAGSTNLKSISGAQVTDIGRGTFSYCSNLTSVSFPAVTSIGYYAFSGYSGLTSVSFPAATSIGERAFWDCRGLTSVNFPAATSIGEGAFSDCDSLTSVSFPQATSIGEMAFSYSGLTSVSFPKATTIGEGAFCYTDLTSVSFPKATSVGEGAFSDCRGLTSVSLPVATSIGEGAFSGCTSLASLTSANFPAVISIGKKAFYNCRGLTSVDFPAATSIGSDAFYDCRGLTSASFPAAASTGEYAFYGCTSLTSVNLPKATTIGGCAFASTGSAPLSITLGNKAPTVGAEMFYDVNAAKAVTVRYPAGASGYGTAPVNTWENNWGNAFRGTGWAGRMNDNITLTYQMY